MKLSAYFWTYGPESLQSYRGHQHEWIHYVIHGENWVGRRMHGKKNVQQKSHQLAPQEATPNETPPATIPKESHHKLERRWF